MISFYKEPKARKLLPNNAPPPPQISIPVNHMTDK